jgi:hypothetical protein
VLSTIPPESRVAVSNYYSNLRAKKDHRLTTTETKQLGTIIARQQHYYEFVTTRLNIADVTLNSLPLSTTNEIFYMYAEGLTASDTIQGTPIKASTVSEYLRAAADFVKIVGQRSECPMTDPKTGKQFTKITKLVKKYRRWEAMPNRQQPLTKKMVQDELLCTKGWDQDCKERAFLDWCVIGLHMGYRRCEWANEKTPKHMADFRRVEELEHKPIYQLLLDDMEFFNKDGERIREVTTCPPDKIGGVRFTVRFQKNGMHGQKVTHAANHTK